MLSPRRAIKLRKSWISKKRHFSTCRPPSLPIFGNVTKYQKNIEKSMLPLKNLRISCWVPGGQLNWGNPEFQRNDIFRHFLSRKPQRTLRPNTPSTPSKSWDQINRPLFNFPGALINRPPWTFIESLGVAVRTRMRSSNSWTMLMPMALAS